MPEFRLVATLENCEVIEELIFQFRVLVRIREEHSFLRHYCKCIKTCQSAGKESGFARVAWRRRNADISPMAWERSRPRAFRRLVSQVRTLNELREGVESQQHCDRGRVAAAETAESSKGCVLKQDHSSGDGIWR